MHNTLGSPGLPTHLSAQMKVAEQNGGFRTCDKEDNKHQEQEAKHIIHLMRPASTECKNMSWFSLTVTV